MSSARTLFDANESYGSGDHGSAGAIRQFDGDRIVEAAQKVPTTLPLVLINGE